MRTEKKLELIKEIISDMATKIDETAYVVDLSDDVEEIFNLLDLDITFLGSEVQVLKRLKFKLDPLKQNATREYYHVPIHVEKFDRNKYEIDFGSDNDIMCFNSNDLNDLDPKSNLFQAYFKKYKKGIFGK